MPVHVETIRADAISGWAADDIEPDRPLTIAVRLGGEVIGRAVANGEFVVAISDPGDIVSAFAERGLTIEVERERGAIGGPACIIGVTFARHLLDNEMLGSAARLFGDASAELFAMRIAGMVNRPDHGPALRPFCFDLLNCGRGFFPADARGTIFDRLGRKLSLDAGMVHAARFYQARAGAATGPAPAPPTIAATGEEPFRAYGRLPDLAQLGDAPAIGLAPAPMITAERTPSPLLRSGIIRAPAGEQPAVHAWSVRAGERLAETLYRIDFEHLRRSIDAGEMLVLDMSAEAPQCGQGLVDATNAALDDLGVPPAQVLLVTQNLAFPRAARRSGLHANAACAQPCLKRDADLIAGVLGSERRLLEHMTSLLAKRAASTNPRKFVCLNDTPAWPGLATILTLSANGHLDEGYVSFPAGNIDTSAIPGIRNRTRCLEHAPRLSQRCPLGVEVDAKAWPAQLALPAPAIENSYFHVVTEPEMSDGSVRRISTNILKPLLGLQPFLLMGNPGALQLLRDLGFRTFRAVLDEGYDDIKSPAQRFDAVEAEMLRCLALDIPALRALCDEIAEALVHNLMHLVRVAPLLFGNTVEARLRCALAAA